jgi:acyl-CoA hydrolase
MIVAKLHAYQETGSEKHLRDARGIVATQWGRLNLDGLTRRARAAEVEDIWLALLEAMGK